MCGIYIPVIRYTAAPGVFSVTNMWMRHLNVLQLRRRTFIFRPEQLRLRRFLKVALFSQVAGNTVDMLSAVTMFNRYINVFDVWGKSFYHLRYTLSCRMFRIKNVVLMSINGG